MIQVKNFGYLVVILMKSVGGSTENANKYWWAIFSHEFFYRDPYKIVRTFYGPVKRFGEKRRTVFNILRIGMMPERSLRM
jgi:hypothetical protein